jgi:hypothetical protein
VCQNIVSKGLLAMMQAAYLCDCSPPRQDDLGAVASFAYDAVLTVASGARTLADQVRPTLRSTNRLSSVFGLTGRRPWQRAAMVPPGQGHWWRGKRQVGGHPACAHGLSDKMSVTIG